MGGQSRPITVEQVTLGNYTTTLRAVRGGPISIVFLHGIIATSFFFEPLMRKLPEGFSAYAFDLRGHGDAESEAYDARAGLLTFAEDLYALLKLLGLRSVHIVGWSIGGGIALQFAISHPAQVISLTLEATISPFGLYGTKDAQGTLCWENSSGSGGGTITPKLLEALRKPVLKHDPELSKLLYREGLKAKVGPGLIPGVSLPSPNWPGYRPGPTGIMNAVSPLYCNLTPFAHINPKPPVLWIRGDCDKMVSDSIKISPAYLGKRGIIPNWPGQAVFPDQPQLQQIRLLLEKYAGNGGKYREVVLEDCGHLVHLEKEAEFLREVLSFIASAHDLAFPSSKL